MPQTQQHVMGKTANFKRNGLIVECVFNDSGRLKRKTERFGLQCTEYAYQYDAKGHPVRDVTLQIVA